MKLPALAIATAFAFGIACGLNSEIAHRSRSHAFIAFLLCSAATSLLIGIVFAVRSQSLLRDWDLCVVLGDARHGWGLH
jgi:hypothetical protein